jgi:hypothetical protein
MSPKMSAIGGPISSGAHVDTSSLDIRLLMKNEHKNPAMAANTLAIDAMTNANRSSPKVE